MFSRAFKRLAICAFWVCLRLQFGQFMRFVSLFLSLLVVTTAVAQKPLDRGVHKRKTGGVSVLWGKKKMHDVDRSELDAPNELLPRETLEPEVMRIPVAKVVALESPTGEWNPAPATFLTENRLVHRVLRPLKRRGFVVVAGPAMDKRLFRRSDSVISRTKQSSDSFDWMSLLAMFFATLGLVATGFSLGWWGGFLKVADTLTLWCLSLAFLFGFLGMRRTKRRKRRGGILALVSFIVGAILPATAIIVLITLLTGSFSIPF